MNNSTNFIIGHEIVNYVKNANIQQMYALIMNGNKDAMTSALFASCMWGNEYFVKEAIKLRKLNYKIIQTVDSNGLTPIKYAERNKYPEIKKMLEKELIEKKSQFNNYGYKINNVRDLDKYVRQKSLEDRRQEMQRTINQRNEGGVHQQLPVGRFSREFLEKRAQQEVNQELFTSRY